MKFKYLNTKTYFIKQFVLRMYDGPAIPNVYDFKIRGQFPHNADCVPVCEKKMQGQGTTPKVKFCLKDFF